MSDNLERRVARLEAIFALPDIDADAQALNVEPDPASQIVDLAAGSGDGQIVDPAAQAQA